MKQSVRLFAGAIWLMVACCAHAARPATVFANFGSINTNTTADVAGNRVYVLTFQTTQYGTQFFGVFNLACEVTGKDGVKYFGTAKATQQRGYAKRTICEWEFEVKTADITAPSLTGYYVSYSAPEVEKPLDKRAFGCSSEEALTARNTGSKPLIVRAKVVRLVDGQN